MESRDIYVENRILKSGNDERMMRLYTVFSFFRKICNIFSYFCTKTMCVKVLAIVQKKNEEVK